MKNRYSLIIIDENNKQYKIRFKYVNPELKVTELTNKLPLKTIVDITTMFNSEEEFIKYLVDKKILTSASLKKIVIGYHHDHKQKFLNLAYSDAILLKGVKLSEKEAKIQNIEPINKLFEEIRILSRNKESNKKELLENITSTKLHELFKKYFNGEDTVDKIKENLKNYRCFYDLVLFCLDFRKKYQIGLESKTSLAHQDENYIHNFYLGNLDKILENNPNLKVASSIQYQNKKTKFNHLIDKDEQPVLFDSNGESKDFYRSKFIDQIQTEYENELFKYYGCSESERRAHCGIQEI